MMALVPFQIVDFEFQTETLYGKKLFLAPFAALLCVLCGYALLKFSAFNRKGRKENLDDVRLEPYSVPICNHKSEILLVFAIFRDGHDFVLEDEKIGTGFASKTDHVAIVRLDPAVDHFSVRQLDADRLLFLA
jgi:hypothetical protein